MIKFSKFDWTLIEIWQHFSWFLFFLINRIVQHLCFRYFVHFQLPFIKFEKKYFLFPPGQSFDQTAAYSSFWYQPQSIRSTSQLEIFISFFLVLASHFVLQIESIRALVKEIRQTRPIIAPMGVFEISPRLIPSVNWSYRL